MRRWRQLQTTGDDKVDWRRNDFARLARLLLLLQLCWMVASVSAAAAAATPSSRCFLSFVSPFLLLVRLFSAFYNIYYGTLLLANRCIIINKLNDSLKLLSSFCFSLYLRCNSANLERKSNSIWNPVPAGKRGMHGVAISFPSIVVVVVTAAGSVCWYKAAAHKTSSAFPATSTVIELSLLLLLQWSVLIGSGWYANLAWSAEETKRSILSERSCNPE